MSLFDKAPLPDLRRKDEFWKIHNHPPVPQWEGAMLAVLMDLRDELKEIKVLLQSGRNADGEMKQVLLNGQRNADIGMRRLAQALGSLETKKVRQTRAVTKKVKKRK